MSGNNNMTMGYMVHFKAEWEKVTKRLKRSNYNLSRIYLVEEGKHDTGSDKRSSKNDFR